MTFLMTSGPSSLDDEVKLLYAVNRALFDIAMNLRYEEVMISADSDELPKGNDIRLFLFVLSRSENYL